MLFYKVDSSPWASRILEQLRGLTLAPVSATLSVGKQASVVLAALFDAE